MKMHGNVENRNQDSNNNSSENTSYSGSKGKVSCTHKVPTSGSEEDGALFNVLPAYASSLSSLEKAKIKHAKNTNLAWKSLDGWYSKTDDSKAYLVASVLDPRVKMRYFEKTWKNSWLTGAREKLEEHTTKGNGDSFDCEMDSMSDEVIPNVDVFYPLVICGIF